VVVKTPMDLGTVYQRLLATSSASNSQMAGYDHPGAAVRDVRLVWSNARLYNGRSSDVGKARSPTRGLAGAPCLPCCVAPGVRRGGAEPRYLRLREQHSLRTSLEEEKDGRK
jgi:hypothetical protein